MPKCASVAGKPRGHNFSGAALTPLGPARMALRMVTVRSQSLSLTSAPPAPAG